MRCRGPSCPSFYMRVPVVSAGRVIAFVNVDNLERENAYGEAEVRLLSTVAARWAWRCRTRATSTKRSACSGDRAARGRAGGNQQHPAGQGRGAELPGHRRPGRRQAARGAEHRQHRHSLVRSESELIHFLYEYEHGQRLPIEPIARSRRAGSAEERTRRPVVLNSRAEMAAAGIRSIPGTEPGCRWSSCRSSAATA